MVEQDTIKLLRECDAGVKMGAAAIGDVLGHAKSGRLRGFLRDSMDENRSLKNELQSVLHDYQDAGREPNSFVRTMSRMKTGMKLAFSSEDSTVAELMIDGCNMGIKSLSRYMNQYKAADERSKELAMRIVDSEERLSGQMREFL